MTNSIQRACARGIAAIPLLMLVAAAWAQPQEVSRGGLTLRSSTVASGMIDQATADRHGIEQAPDVGVLNVVLARSETGRLQPIPAQVEATAWSLSGIRQEIEMREVRENGRVSYMGTYDFLPREVIDFRITAKPLDAPSVSLSLAYRDRMWRP